MSYSIASMICGTRARILTLSIVKPGASIGALFPSSSFFFFSSRRRHTRCGRDWSSDVCSSDLGLLRSAVGGTPVQAWLSEETLATIGDYREILTKCRADDYVKHTIAAENERIEEWYRRLHAVDEGYQNGKLPWARPSFDDSQWPVFNVPNSWEGSELAGVNGAVWFRKEFTVPKEMLEYEGLLRLGAIIDADEVYLNGALVGKTGYKYPPRKYPVSKGVLRAGKNILAVRVISN